LYQDLPTVLDANVKVMVFQERHADKWVCVSGFRVDAEESPHPQDARAVHWAQALASVGEDHSA